MRLADRFKPTRRQPAQTGPIPFPPDPPAGLPSAAPCPQCRLGLFWLDAYDRLHCYDCDPPAVEAFAARWLFVVSGPTSSNAGPQPPFEWRDFDWMRDFPPRFESELT